MRIAKVKDEKKLDNPVWFSLSEDHQNLAFDFGNIKFYHPDYCSFGGVENKNDISNPIDNYSTMIDNFFIVGEKPEFSDNLKLKKELVCFQMIINDRIDLEIKENIVSLTNEHADTLYQLVNLVQPGYFRKRTILLGNYFGIFKDDKLIAVAGERMKMNSFVEVSAIVTHPDHTRKGYAKQLIVHTVNNIFRQNKTPYLHVAENNFGAINLYKKSGFKIRRKISFWNLIK